MSRAWAVMLGWGLALGLAAAGWTSEDRQDEPVFEVEVVGVGEPTPPGMAATSVSVITATEIERSGAQNLMDLLVREPGVWVSRRGGMGYGGNVSIRGFGGSPPTQVAVLLDGHPTQMGIMGHILPTSYILDNVKRIEVLRGAAGALYGDMAIGGVINIVTRGSHDEESRGAISGAGGNFDTLGGQLWFRELRERSGYRAQLGRFSTDGHNPFALYKGDNYSLAVDHTLRDQWEMAFRGQRLFYTTYDQREVATAYAEGREAQFIEQDYDRGDYDLEFRRHAGDRTTSIKLYRTEGEHQFQDGFHSKDFGHGVMVSRSAPVARGRGQWGLAWRSAGGDIHSPAPLVGSFSRHERAAYFMVDQRAGDRTDLAAGLRYTAPQGFGTEWLPHLGLTHELQDGWSAFTSVRRGYRVPSFRELLLFGINNPDLKPESAWQYEIGARKRLPSGAQIEISAFRIDADDLIVLGPRPEGVPGPPVQLANAGQATRDGFEVGARWPAGLRTALYANFSYLDAGAIRQQTVGRKAALGVDHRLEQWLLSGDLQYVDRLFDFDQTNALVKVPAFAVVNVKAARGLARGAGLGVVVENLFNHGYRVDPAYPYAMPGRSVRLQLEQSW